MHSLDRRLPLLVLLLLLALPATSDAGVSALASASSSASFRIVDIRNDAGQSLGAFPAGFSLTVQDPPPSVTQLILEEAEPGNVTFGGTSTATNDGLDSVIDLAVDLACEADPGGLRYALEDAFNGAIVFANTSPAAVTVIVEFVTSFSLLVNTDRPSAFAEIVLNIDWPVPSPATATIVDCPGGSLVDDLFRVDRTVSVSGAADTVAESSGPDTCQIAVRIPVLGPNFSTGGLFGNLASCRVMSPDLDHFVTYKTKPTKGQPRPAKFGPVTLTDQFRFADYDVKKPLTLGVPGNKNGEGIVDPLVHLTEYQIKAAKGAPKFSARTGIRIVNQCNDLLLEAKRPISLLVPTGKDLSVPAIVPDPGSHTVDHFLCYKAKLQRKRFDGTKLPKFPKGMQVEVADQFQTRRYDLKGITKLCNPTEKAGTPFVLSGPDKGTPKPITPAAIDQPGSHLVCYKARLAKKEIAQDGCGILTVGDKGVKIDPKQPKHEKRTGVFIANQFDSGRIDTKTEFELCIPSAKF